MFYCTLLYVIIMLSALMILIICSMILVLNYAGFSLFKYYCFALFVPTPDAPLFYAGVLRVLSKNRSESPPPNCNLEFSFIFPTLYFFEKENTSWFSFVAFVFECAF